MAMSYYDDQEVKKFILDAVSIDAEDLISFVSQQFDPEDVFSANRLEAWAEENGYILEEE